MDNINYWSKQNVSDIMSGSYEYICVSHLDVLQPVGGVWGAGQREMVFRRHPGLQALQLCGGSVSGHMTHQVALELV